MNKYKMAICHPDRLHKARGLCNACYLKLYRNKDRTELDRHHITKFPRGTYKVACHPCRSVFSLGLCKSCYEMQRRRRTDPHRIKTNMKAYTYRLKVRYGMTRKEYDSMMELQEGLCAVCKQRPATHVDHDHVTGKARGILCMSCNTALGMFRDNLNIILNAALYLEQHQV